jgi:hypothetical protein
VYTQEYTLVVTSSQTDYSEHELLENHRYAEPLYAGGIRCHGGFDDDGRYVSPRTVHRVPAIEAWEEARAEAFGTATLDIPLDRWPLHVPNVAQAKFLIANGVPGPIISTLTRIGTVEGFGGFIRTLPIPDLARCFDEDVRGTAMAHLERGLYEAHARDEAGFEDEGGHKDMWFAARDVAFEHPVDDEDVLAMLQRMGFNRPGSGNAAPAPPRLLPDDVDADLEGLIEFMARLLLIEISAFHTFAWAEEVLSDIDLVAGDGEAARLVSYIRSDETPHVAYLKTTLSEMRDRTFLGSSGKRYAGADLIARVWDRSVADSLGARREANLKLALGEVEHALDGHPRRADLLAEFHSLATVEVAA